MEATVAQQAYRRPVCAGARGLVVGRPAACWPRHAARLLCLRARRRAHLQVRPVPRQGRQVELHSVDAAAEGGGPVLAHVALDARQVLRARRGCRGQPGSRQQQSRQQAARGPGRSPGPAHEEGGGRELAWRQGPLWGPVHGARRRRPATRALHALPTRPAPAAPPPARLQAHERRPHRLARQALARRDGNVVCRRPRHALPALLPRHDLRGACERCSGARSSGAVDAGSARGSSPAVCAAPPQAPARARSCLASHTQQAGSSAVGMLGNALTRPPRTVHTSTITAAGCCVPSLVASGDTRRHTATRSRRPKISSTWARGGAGRGGWTAGVAAAAAAPPPPAGVLALPARSRHLSAGTRPPARPPASSCSRPPGSVPPPPPACLPIH